MNLLKETKQILKENGKKIEDIKWIGSNKNYVDIEKFIEIADTKYDDGYGASEVATNLLIVGDDWWLEREEYDGSEWWEFKSIPKKPKTKLELKALTIQQSPNIDISCGWETLERINGIIEDDDEN